MTDNHHTFFITEADEGSWVSKQFPPFAVNHEYPKSCYFIVDAATGEVFENALTEREACNAYHLWSDSSAIQARKAKNLVVQVVRTVEVRS